MRTAPSLAQGPNEHMSGGAPPARVLRTDDRHNAPVRFSLGCDARNTDRGSAEGCQNGCDADRNAI